MDPHLYALELGESHDYRPVRAKAAVGWHASAAGAGNSSPASIITDGVPLDFVPFLEEAEVVVHDSKLGGRQIKAMLLPFVLREETALLDETANEAAIGLTVGDKSELPLSVLQGGARNAQPSSSEAAASEVPPSSSVVAAVDAPYCDAKPKTPPAASEEIALLPASETRLCTVELVQWPAELAFDLLRITAHPSESGQDEDLPLTLAFCSAALERGQPLLVLFDLRDGRTPPFWSCQGLINTVVEWASAHARQWDGQVQGLAIIVPGQIVRAFLNMITGPGLLNPPQPVRYCETVEEALAFFRPIREARSYEKDHY